MTFLPLKDGLALKIVLFITFLPLESAMLWDNCEKYCLLGCNAVSLRPSALVYRGNGRDLLMLRQQQLEQAEVMKMIGKVRKTNVSRLT
jgi:hypothetical protein